MDLPILITMTVVVLVGFAWAIGWKPKVPKFRLKDDHEPTERPDDTPKRPRRAAYGAARARTEMTKETPK